jgi:alpha-methylacyl-CoA racemase
MLREFEATFAAKTRDEWASHFEGADACAAPVLSFEEAASHPHNKARGTFIEADGALQPPAAPRFSRSAIAPRRSSGPGKDALDDWGIQYNDLA